MQDSISKTIEITGAKANTFKHFGLVVAALCISIRPWNIQCVEYLLRPVVVGRGALLKRRERIQLRLSKQNPITQ